MPSIQRIPTPYSYSSAVMAGDYVFLGLHRGFGEDFSTQFQSAIKNLRETLSRFGFNLECILKVTVWLKDIKDLPVMERLFNDYFKKDSFPARMTATTEFIDEYCLLMIEGIAYSHVEE